MGVLFVHDHKFRKVKNQFFSTGGLSNDVLERYVSVFDDVVVLSRVIQASESERFSKITNKKIKIIESNWNFKNLKKIKKTIKMNDFIIIRLPSINGLIASYYAKKYKKKYFIEVAGCGLDSYRYHSFKGRLLGPVLYYLMKKCIKNSSYTLYVTEKFLQSRYPSDGVMLACSDVILSKHNEDILSKRINKISNYGKSIITLITVAAIDVTYKGQDRVIKMLNLLKAEGFTNYEYKIIGSGDKSYLEKLGQKLGVADQIQFIGSIPHIEVPEMLSEADIYIQPSKTEGLPRAVVEAMAMAMPVIGANTGGIPELINKNMIFENNDSKSSEDLKKIVLNLNKNQLKQEAIANFQKSLEFDKDRLDNKRKNFYKQYKDSV